MQHEKTKSSRSLRNITASSPAPPPPKTPPLPPPGTPAFIHDKTFSYLPAIITSQTDLKTATVQIKLPSDWSKSTITANGSPSTDGDDDQTPSIDGETRVVYLAEYPNGELPLQNVDEKGEILGRADMTDLKHLHEAGILYNLKNRHSLAVPYTKVGDIILATNPFHWIEGLYSDETRRKFTDTIFNKNTITDDNSNSNLPSAAFYKTPTTTHAYETSSLAYRGLAVDRVDQSILVTGDSGAGKTETIKIVMSHLASIQQSINEATAGESKSLVVKRILDSNLLFEAFGNAKTVRNDNSSRFGKLTQLSFDVATSSEETVPTCSLVGSKFVTYLLEKSRVVGHDRGERNYHIFYQLISAPMEVKVRLWSGLSSVEHADFSYLQPHKPPTSKGARGKRATIQDNFDPADIFDENTTEEAWHRTIASLKLFGIVDSQCDDLMRSLVAMLQLGNLKFGGDPANDEQAIISNPEELEKLADVLGIALDKMTEALLKRKVVTIREEIEFALSPEGAKDSCDALAKEMYNRIFDYLVRTINSSTNTSGDSSDDGTDKGVISLLDIFGFELFKINRFEQLCINYANERLQQKYVSDIFKSVVDEYEEEGIHIFDFSKVDNAGILELIESKTGLIALLNDECIRPKGNPSSYVYKIKAVHMHSPYLIKEKLHRPHEFAVNHFASPVKYDATTFLERNSDLLPLDVVDCVRTSGNNALIRSEFSDLMTTIKKDMAEKSKGKKKGGSGGGNTVISKFKAQLNDLTNTLKGTRTRYIRCIKPNAQKKPFVLDHAMTMLQLECAGLVTALHIQRETYPNKLSYEVILDRFTLLLDPNDEHDATVQQFFSATSDKEKTELLLSILLRGKDRLVRGAYVKPYAMGKTKVFFKAGMVEHLELERKKLYDNAACVIQRCVRNYQGKKEFQALKQTVIKLQAWMRGRLAVLYYRRCIHAIVTMQVWARWMAKKNEQRILRMNEAVGSLQASWRMFMCRRHFRRCKRAVRLIQREVRNKKNKTSFKSALAVCVEQSMMNNRFRQLQAEFDTLDMEGLPDNIRKFLDNSHVTMKYFGGEVFSLRQNVTDLQEQLSKEQHKLVNMKTVIDKAGGAMAVQKSKIQSLTQKTNEIIKKANRSAKENRALKMAVIELKKNDETKTRAAAERESQLKRDHQKQVSDLQRQLKAAQEEHARQMAQLQREKEDQQAEHERKMASLEEQLRKEEEAHKEDLEKMFEAIETTKKRGKDAPVYISERNLNDKNYDDEEEEEEEGTSLNESAKDAEIRDLRKQIQEMKLMQTIRRSTVGDNSLIEELDLTIAEEGDDDDLDLEDMIKDIVRGSVGDFGSMGFE